MHCFLSIHVVLQHFDHVRDGLTEYTFVDDNIALHLSVIKSCGKPLFLFLLFLFVAFVSSSILFLPFHLHFLLQSLLRSLLCMVSYRVADNDEVASTGTISGDHARDRHDPPSFFILQCIEQYCVRLEGRRLYAMHLAGDLHKVSKVCTDHTQDTASSTCEKRCWHWGWRGAPDSWFYHPETNRPYMSCSKGVCYTRCLDDILRRLGASGTPIGHKIPAR